MKRTKIVCTIGPATAEKGRLVELFQAGMNVARLNFSHGTHEWHRERIHLLREIEAEHQRPIAILQDLWGVCPLLVAETTSGEKRFATMIQAAKSVGWIKSGQTVAIATGATVGTAGSTNGFRLDTV